YSRVQHLDCGERVNRGAVAHLSHIDVFLRPVRNRQQSGPVGVGWNTQSSVKPSLQKPGTHLKPRGFATDGLHALGERAAETIAFRSSGGAALLQNLPLQ